ncbi:MAG: hypothetical protein LRY66_08435 [Saccharospirillaceae bacterium]|nr:hypothetical protein [Saccharospirillaceae bacterium]MCD8531376.1 hypothetical protein [Saccharospirillaceae bacterium]
MSKTRDLLHATGGLLDLSRYEAKKFKSRYHLDLFYHVDESVESCWEEVELELAHAYVHILQGEGRDKSAYEALSNLYANKTQCSIDSIISNSVDRLEEVVSIGTGDSFRGFDHMQSRLHGECSRGR